MGRRNRTTTISSMAQARSAPDGKHPVARATGLFLKVEGASRAWVVRYRLGGRRPEMGLGPIDRVSIDEARRETQDALRLRDQGVDPIQDRNQRRSASLAKAKAPRPQTFSETLDAFLTSNGPRWKHPRSVANWRGPLARHALPIIGDIATRDIDTPHIVAILDGAKTKGLMETARRLQVQLAKVINFAALRGQRDKGDPNPASAALLKSEIPGREGEPPHFRRIDLDDAPAAFQALYQRILDDPNAAALAAWALAILTAVRPSAALTAMKAEFILPLKMWTIPAHKPGIKNRRDFSTPLSPPALRLVERQLAIAPGDRLFPSPRGGGGIPYSTFDQATDRAGLNLGTAHSWRSVFADWAREKARADLGAVEKQLAHALPKVQAAYLRGDLLEERRALLDRYAEWLLNDEAHAVVPSPGKQA